MDHETIGVQKRNYRRYQKVTLDRFLVMLKTFWEYT